MGSPQESVAELVGFDSSRGMAEASAGYTPRPAAMLRIDRSMAAAPSVSVPSSLSAPWLGEP